MFNAVYPKMRILVLFVVSFFTPFIYSGVYSQCSNLEVNAGTAANIVTETIYSENFTGQIGKGAIGSSTDLTGCNWTIDVNAATLSNNGDWFKVSNVSNSEKLEAKDVDGICYWYSPAVNIVDYKSVSLSLKASESGFLENNDIFYSEYSLDGGTWTYFSSNGQLNNDFNSRNVSHNDLKGSSIQIRVTMNVDASNETLHLDDVIITGKSYKINLCYGSSLNLGGSPTAEWSGSGNPPITYLWTPSTSLSDASISNPVANPTSSIIYKVVASLDNNGTTCKDSSRFWVNVTPQITITNNSPVCIDDTLIISESGGDATVWDWSSNGSASILSFEDSSTQVVGMVNGEVFTVSIEDDNGCSNSGSTTIVVNPKPTNVTSTSYGTYCSSDAPFNLSGGSPIGGYYAGQGVSNNMFDPSSVGYGSNLESIDLMYIYVDANGCRDTSLSPVVVQQAPSIELTSPYLVLPPTDNLYIGVSPSGDWSKCGSSNPTFTLQMQISNASVVNNSASITYDIDFGNGASQSNINPGTIYNAVYSIQGPYEIKVTATDNITNCVRTYIKNFFFGTNPAISLGIPGNTQNQCAPRTYGFVASFSDASGILNSPGTLYRKYTNDGKPDSTFIHPSPANSLATHTLYHTFDDASCGYSSQAYDNSFLVGVAASNGCGSSSAEVSPITQSSPPNAKIAPMDTVFCIDEPVTFTDSSSGGKYVYGVNSGSGFSYECDTIDAIAWKFTPNTGFTILSGSLGTLPLNYFDDSTHGTPEIQVSFQNKGVYSVLLYKISPCGSAQVLDSSEHIFKIDSMPEAEFTLDKNIDCSPLEIKTSNISRSKNDYFATFDWSYSTLIQGCQGSAPPSIVDVASDSSLKQVYSENFTGHDGYGAIGSTFNTTGLDWTLDISNTNLVDNDDWFYVVNERFEAVDINTGSPVSGNVKAWNQFHYSNGYDGDFFGIDGALYDADPSLFSPGKFITINVNGTSFNYIISQVTSSSNSQTGNEHNNVRYVYINNINGTSASGVTDGWNLTINDSFNVNAISYGYWYSPSIDVSQYQHISMGLNAFTNNSSVNKAIKSQYKVDGGNWTNFSVNGNLSGNFSSPSTVFQDNINGSNIQLRVGMHLMDDLDTLRMDDVFINGYSIPDSLNADYSFNKPGKYSINLTATNVCSSHTFSETVTAKGPPIVSVNPIADSCATKRLWPSASIDTCFGNMSKFSWSFPGSDTDSSYLASPSAVAYDSVGTFWIYHMAENECGSHLDSNSFTINENPLISLVSTDSVCIGDGIQIFSSVTNGSPNYSYSWSSNGFISSTTNPNPIATTFNDEYYQLTVTDNKGCEDTSSILIDVLALPNVNAGIDQNICPEDTAFLNASINGGIQPYSFYWNQNSLSNTNVLNPYYDMNGSSTFNLIVTDDFGCTSTDQVFVNQYNSPNVNAGDDTTLCDLPISVSFIGTPTGGLWTGLEISSNGLFTPNGVKQEVQYYQYTDPNGCYNEDTLIVDVVAPILSNAGIDFERCLSNDTVNLSGTPYGGIWNHPQVTSSVTTSLYDEYFTGLNGKGATYSGLNLSGCNWSLDVSGAILNNAFQYLKVNNSRLEARDLDGPAYWLSPSININEYVNVSISFIASEWGNMEVNDVIESEYRTDGGPWTIFNNNGQLSDDFNSVTVSQSGLSGANLEFRIKFQNNSSAEYLRADNIVVSGSNSGVFLVSNPDTLDLVYIYGVGNCANNDTVQLIINDLPVVEAGSNISLCVSDSIIFAGTPSGGTWSGDGITDPVGKFVGDSAAVGLHTVYYNYSDTNSCDNTDSLVVNVLALPNVNAGNDTILCNQPGIVDFDGNFIPGYWTGSHTDSAGGFEPDGIGLYNLYYHHTDLNGCYNNDTLNINVIDPTNAIAGTDKQVCIDSGLIQFNGLPVGGVWSGSGISSGGQFTTSVQDTIDLVYSYGTGNCLTRDTFNLIINPLPNLDAGTDFEVCIDDTIQLLNPNLTGGSWSGTGISNSNGDFNPSLAGEGNHVLYYYYKDSNTCDIIDSIKATVYALPLVIAPEDTSICNLPVSVTFNGFPDGGNWLDSNITITGEYSPDGAGVFDLYYEYTDSNSCYNIDTISLTVTIPLIANARQDIQACVDTGLIQLIGLPLGAGNWFGNGIDSSGNYDVNSVDTVDLVYNIGSGNCFTTDTMNLLIHPLPVISVDNSFEICISFGDTVLNFSPQGGTWQGTGITDNINGVFNPVIAGVGTHKLLYSYQHPITACWNYDSLELTVNPLPVVSYTHDSIFCFNTGHQITNTTTEVQNHFWNISEGSNSGLSSPTFSIDTVGFFNISYVAQTNRGCLDSLSSSIEVVAPPVSEYVAPDSGCGPLIVDFTNNSTGKYVSYFWDLGFDNYLGGDSASIDTIPIDHTYPEGVFFDTSYYTSLAVTNMCGTDISSLEIISMPKPVSLFGPNTNVGCLSGTITFANNSYGLPDTYYWDFDDGSFGTNNDTIFDHYYPPGTSNSYYTVTMAVTNECGTDTSQANLTILPSNLIAFFSVDTTVGCVPFEVDFTQFTIGGTSSSWDFADGNFSNVYNPTHTYLDTGIYQVSLAVSNACNYDTAYKTIRVNTSPSVAFSVIDDTLCAGSTFLFNNQSDSAISYNWDFGDGNTSYLTQPTHIFNSEGTYNVVLTGTSLTNDCPAYDSVSLLVLPYPEISASSDLNSGCIPLGINFSSNVNSTGFYSWDFGDGNTSTLENPSHNYSTDGYFNVFVRFEDLSGCVDSFDFDVTAYPVPQIGFSINQLDTCILPANYDFINSTTGATSFNWDFGNGTTSFLTNPTGSFSSDGVYNVQLNVSNTYGCEDSLSNVINVSPVPNASFDLNQLDTCVLPASFNFSNSSNGALAYTWDFGDGSTSNAPNLTYSYSQEGTYIINLYSMNSYGCMDSSSSSVTVFPVPTADFSYTKFDSCVLPSNYSFDNLSSGASSYLWTFGNLANSIQPNPTFTFNNAGVYNIELLTTNSFGCTDNSVKVINVAPIPVADFSLQSSIGCEPFSAIFLNNSTNANFYNWNFGDGNSGSFFNGFHSYSSFGTYIANLVIEDLNGCLDSVFKTITVYPSPVAGYTYTASDPCYLPIDVNFTNTSLGAISFEWNFGNGQTSFQTHPSSVYDSIGIYNTQLVVGNSYNCTDTLNDIFNVFFNEVPVAQFNFDDTLCLRDTSFINSNSLYADSLFWDLGSGNYSIGDSIAFVYENPGEYDITLYAFNNISGCSDTLSANSPLVVLPSPSADFYYEHQFGTEPFTGRLSFYNMSVGADNYYWSFDVANSSTETNPLYNYNYSVEGEGLYFYTLYAYNTAGCVDSSTQDLYVDFKSAIFVPNALYPNHSNPEVANFVPKGVGMIEYHIEIFDTFGNVIWESKSIDDEGKPTGSWDGTYNGVPVEQDVYVWKIQAKFKDNSSWEGREFEDETELFKTGTVTVIR